MMPPTEWKPRELEILRLLEQGLTNNEIGVRLHLAPDTVRWYNKQIFAKLGVNTRAQAVRQAAALGLGAAPAPTTPAASGRARPPVQYAANGDVHLAYQVLGEGPVDLLFIHGFLSHLEMAWDNPEFAAFFEGLGRSVRVILFDKRGVGLSDRPASAPTLEETIADARCVLAAAGSTRAFVMGTSEGGAAAVMLAAVHPEQVHGLILYAATAMVVQRQGEPAWADPEADFERSLARLPSAWGGPWAVDNFAPSRAPEPEFRAWWARLLRAAASPAAVQAVLNNVRAVDIRPLLPQVRARTLVLHKTHDRIVNVAAGCYLAAHLPRATWVELAGHDHIYFVDSAAIVAAVAQFCQGPVAAGPVESRLAIILCARTAAGDTLALFDSPTRAVAAARQRRAVGGAVSLHVGECRLVNGEPHGAAVMLARQAAALAAPGEVLVTRTLHDILAGTEWVFTERAALGDMPLYGLAEGGEDGRQ